MGKGGAMPKKHLTFSKEDREQLMQLYIEDYVYTPGIKHRESLDMLVREGFALRVGEFYRLTIVGEAIAKINAEAEND
jgi:hypothetical protein